MNRFLSIFSAVALSFGFVFAPAPAVAGEEPVIRIEIWAGAPSVDVTLNGLHALEAAMESPTPNRRRVEWELVEALADGDKLVIKATGEGDGEKLAISINGRSPIEMEPHMRLRLLDDADPNAGAAVAKVPFGVGWWWAGEEDRTYRGELEFHAWASVAPADGHKGFGPQPDGGVQIVFNAPLDEYLRGVLPKEMGAAAPLEALKAQAVAARTYIVGQLGKTIHPGSNIDACSGVHCQVYAGAGAFAESCDVAIRETRGLVCIDKTGAPIAAKFASSCGGWSEAAENVWGAKEGKPGEKQPGHEAHPDAPKGKITGFDLTKDADLRRWVDNPPVDAWCSADRAEAPDWSRKNWRWEREFTAQEAADMIAKREKGIGRLKRVETIRRGPSGRYIEARVIGTSGEAVVGPELALRQLFDPPLRSAACYFEPGPADADGAPKSWIVRGAGWGHGAGMCQTGAISQAKSGIKFDAIVVHYFRGTKLEKQWD